ADVGAWTAAQSAASEKALSDEVATAFKIRPNLTATDSPNTLRGSAMFGHYGVPGAAAATTDKGYPMNGFVGVIFVTWGPNATQQIAFNNNGRQFTRGASGAWNGVDGPWTAWNEIYCQANKPTPADVGALPAGGTAVAASKLATARKIAGVAFDGTQDINLSAANVGALPSGGTAVAATKLATARKIAGVAFDGTQDIGLNADNVGAFPRVGGDVNGRVTANYLRAITIPHPGDGQGTYLGWNESGGQGESNFVNNRGGGVGGFKFRIVNQGNTVQTGEMTLSGNGDSNTSGTVNEMGQRVFSPNNRQPVNSNTANLGGGWWRCGDTGMIKQWGVVNKGSRGWSTVNFPIPFPSTCVNVQVTAINGGGGTFNDNFGTAQIINNIGFTCGQDSGGSYWEATGW
ncbi:pyocin knob domain-containing protein, partial [Rahnella aceris]